MSAPAGSTSLAQLDLFVDGAATALLHAVGEALVAGRPRDAHEGLARLREHDPAHPDLAAVDRLCQAVRPGRPALGSPRAVETLVRELETVLLPAAERLLGPHAAVALVPVWRRLADGTAAAIDALDGTEAGGRARFWVGAAHHHVGRRREARRIWLRLAWRQPGALASLASRCPDDTIRLTWAAFERAPSFQVPDDPEAAARWFPAWAFLHERELTGLFTAGEISGASVDAPEAAAREVLALLPLEARGLSEEVVRGRRALKAVAPAFFQHYLARVGR